MATEYACCILWGENVLWDSDNGPFGYDGIDAEVSIEYVVRREMATLEPAIEWLTRDLPRPAVSFDHLVTRLNEWVQLDAEALRQLVETRVPCNEALAGHPTVKVQDREGTPEVGILGILNGLFGAHHDGWGQLAAVFDKEGNLEGFGRCIRSVENLKVHLGPTRSSVGQPDCGNIDESTEQSNTPGQENT